MRKIITAGIATAALAVPAAAATAAGAATSTSHAPARVCRWYQTDTVKRGNAGHITVDMRINTCGRWWARVQCHANTGGVTAWHTSTIAPEGSGETIRTAGCPNGAYPSHGGWVGRWNHVYHQDF
jgi:hypothetical protein